MKRVPNKPTLLKAKTTKALYNCVRDPKTGRLTLKEDNILTFSENIEVSKSNERETMPEKSEKETKCQAGKYKLGK